MALVLADRVQETSTSPGGTGTLNLSGTAPAGFKTFSSGIGTGNSTYYCIFDTTAYDWEVGIGTYTSGSPGTLSRTTVLSNSAGTTSAINFTNGNTLNIFVTYPSEKSVNLDSSGNVSALGTISSGTWQGSTVGVAYGGTGVTASSGANSVVLRDANQNIAVNSVTQNLTITTSAAGTTTLTLASSHFQILTGTTTQTYKLPDATSLPVGTIYVFDNDSTGNLTVQDNALGTVDVVAPGGYSTVFLEANGTVAGEWGRFGMIPNEVNWGTNSLALGGSTIVSGGTWQGNPIAYNYGGTGLTTFTAANYALYSTSASALTAGTLPVAAGGTGATTLTANGVVYGNGTSAAGVTAAGTTGQVLVGNTGAAPSWATVSSSLVSSFSAGTTGFTPSTATTGAVTLAGTLNVANGGTGLTSTPSNGQIDIGNGTGFTRTTLSAGSGVSISNGSGSITISATGTGGTVTSVTGTSPVSVATGTTTPVISLASGYGDTQNPYASKTANYFLAAPNGSAGAPTFRAIVAADIPTLNQNTTGTASNITAYTINQNLGTGNSPTFSSINTTTATVTPNNGGVSTGFNVVNGDITVYRSGGTTGVVYFNSAGTRYLYWDGTNYNLNGANVVANGTTLTGNTGTVTSVSGTGTVSGLTLSGTVTTSGSLTLGGTLSVTPAAVSDQANTSTGYFGMPTGTTAQRPGTAAAGYTRYNSTETALEYYNGSTWRKVSNEGFTYAVDYLVVAGGGGGSSHGGGGAGGYLAGSTTLSSGTAYSITVGSGGSGNYPAVGGNGTNSSGFSITSTGGGGGGGSTNGGASTGGSGGGATASGAGTYAGAAGTPGQGNSGGSATSFPGQGNCGGGGGGQSASGGNGVNSPTRKGGDGGAGGNWQSLGTYYAGGGGGGCAIGSGVNSSGGTGGGGAGAGPSSTNGTAGTANTGGGGGGTGGNSSYSGGSGGSGVVIVRYSGSQRGSGGTVTSAGGYTYHTFTTSGTYTA